MSLPGVDIGSTGAKAVTSAVMAGCWGDCSSVVAQTGSPRFAVKLAIV